MLKKLTFSFCFIIAIQVTWSQRIEIQGNGVVIVGDGTNTPMLNDDTFFDTTPVSGARIHTFKLTNKDVKDIRVESIRSGSKFFKVSGKIGRLRDNQSKTFDIAFEPDKINYFNTTVTIKVKIGRTKKTYTFNIAGESSAFMDISEIMISQYYENGNEDQIEIKNLSNYDIKQKKYYLAKYNRNDDLKKEPRRGNLIEIGRMEPGATAIYGQFDIRGNEIIIISKSKGKKCYADRIDIIGEQKLWGKRLSFSKGACASESAHTQFDLNDWIRLSLDEVDQAFQMQNLYLGTYQVGPISWTDKGWTGNALPDRTRNTFIEAVYEGDIRSGSNACAERAI